MIIILSSCKKNKFVHFFGRITFACNQEPARNVTFRIHRNYDSGSEQEFVVEGTTDNSGAYSVLTDVDQGGSFTNYYLIADRGIGLNSFIQQGTCGSSDDNSANVHIDGQIEKYNLYSFHLKNLATISGIDAIEFITTYPDLYYAANNFDPTTIWSNINGSNIETTVFCFSNYSPLFYKYSYRSNGTPGTSSIDSILSADCFDTARVDIVY